MVQLEGIQEASQSDKKWFILSRGVCYTAVHIFSDSLNDTRQPEHLILSKLSLKNIQS